VIEIGYAEIGIPVALRKVVRGSPSVLHCSNVFGFDQLCVTVVSGANSSPLRRISPGVRPMRLVKVRVK
jgi:hypothetical protein